ncbi:hypothetical protein CSZ94_10410 [Janthinobacterium sp. ROICE36]|uniref:DUF1428 family protein n=1 Tax=Janthinobacterium sp. ROICE36 TaxID=2048670 RepID=UPI000C7ECAE7|nr:DUF1428 family protein [Janthinobacterium sp. ROICE36]PLY42580.1 hypothetical protein CSZ94_10410 [Janthinobacterium sp. ROICE36]
MAYVDGFVVPVPKAKLDTYLAMSRACGEFRECVGDDVKPAKLPFDGKRMIYGGYEMQVDIK